MSRNSSRTPCASISRKTAGNGPPRSGRQMKVSIAPSLVAMSRVCSIIPHSAALVAERILPKSSKQPTTIASRRKPGPIFPLANCFGAGIIVEVASEWSKTCGTVGPGFRRDAEMVWSKRMAVQAIGQRVRREEDFRLLTGRGRYVDDVPAIGPGGAPAARGYVLRSPHAHARIRSIDTRQAAAMPGVLAVLTGAELRRRGLGTLRPLVPRRRGNGGPAFVCPQPLLAQDCVRYVGDPVAFVIAETLAQ